MINKLNAPFIMHLRIKCKTKLKKNNLAIVDEVDFNDISPLEAKLFFQLIDLKFTKHSTIFTSNISFDKWPPQILDNDEMMTKAILDKILHYSYLFNINDSSY